MGVIRILRRLSDTTLYSRMFLYSIENQIFLRESLLKVLSGSYEMAVQ